MSEKLFSGPEPDEPKRHLSPLAESEIRANEAYEKLDAAAKEWMQKDPAVTYEALVAALKAFNEAVSERNAEEDVPGHVSDETARPE